MRGGRGSGSGYMGRASGAGGMEATLEAAYTVVTDKKIGAVADILPTLGKVGQVGKPLLSVAEDVDGEALATLVVNKLRGTINVLAIKAPGFGDRRKAMLEDIATLSGARVISEEVGLKLDSVTLEDLGQARRVTATKDNTTIVEGKGDPKAIEALMAALAAASKPSTSAVGSRSAKPRA